MSFDCIAGALGTDVDVSARSTLQAAERVSVHETHSVHPRPPGGGGGQAVALSAGQASSSRTIRCQHHRER